MNRLRRVAALVAALAAAACEGTTGRRVLPPAGFARVTTYGDRTGGGADLRVAAEAASGRQVDLPVELRGALDDRTTLRFEWLPFGIEDRGGLHLTSSGEVVFGVHERLRPPDADPRLPALSAQVFGVSAHGGSTPPRWPGVVDGESGWFGVGSAEWGGLSRTLTLNAGAGAGGRPGRPGRSGRVLAGAGFVQALSPTGIDWSTEPARVGIETFWTHDPVDDRTFGELGLGLSFWVGTIEVDLGWRRGLTPETTDSVFYVGFRTRLFDAWSL